MSSAECSVGKELATQVPVLSSSTYKKAWWTYRHVFSGEIQEDTRSSLARQSCLTSHDYVHPESMFQNIRERVSE